MVKAYLRYEPALFFSVVASPESNVVYDPSGCRLLAAALDRFAAWDLKRGLPSATFTPSSSSPSLAVSCLASSPSAASASASAIARGHTDGSIRLWDAETCACEATLHGHRYAASALRFAPSGAVLTWDVVAQAGSSGSTATAIRLTVPHNLHCGDDHVAYLASAHCSHGNRSALTITSAAQRQLEFS